MGDVYMVNGKIFSGLPNHAKDIEFDNTGTDFISTNAEDAIKEVNSNLSDMFIFSPSDWQVVFGQSTNMLTIYFQPRTGSQEGAMRLRFNGNTAEFATKDSNNTWQTLKTW